MSMYDFCMIFIVCICTDYNMCMYVARRKNNFFYKKIVKKYVHLKRI